MKKLLLFLIPLLALSCKDDDPVSSSDQPTRSIKYAFSGTIYSGPERMTYMIEHNGDLVTIESNHSYPYVSNVYDLKKGDNIFVYAQNISNISQCTIRIDMISDTDTLKTVSKYGESPSVQLTDTLQ